HFARTTGFNLLLLSRTREHLEETAKLCTSLGCPAVHIQDADLTDPTQVEKLSAPVGFDNIRALINNAGQYKTDNPERVDAETILHQFEHNALTAALVTRRF